MFKQLSHKTKTIFFTGLLFFLPLLTGYSQTQSILIAGQDNTYTDSELVLYDQQAYAAIYGADEDEDGNSEPINADPSPWLQHAVILQDNQAKINLSVVGLPSTISGVKVGGGVVAGLISAASKFKLDLGEYNQEAAENLRLKVTTDLAYHVKFQRAGFSGGMALGFLDNSFAAAVLDIKGINEDGEIVREFAAGTKINDEIQGSLVPDISGTAQVFSEFRLGDIMLEEDNQFYAVFNNLYLLAQAVSGPIAQGGGPQSALVDITINNTSIVFAKAPQAAFSYSPLTPLVNQPITFDAGLSYDPDGTITDYQWDFGDGQFGQGINVEHSYNESGFYPITLTVTDNSGMTAAVTQQVIICGLEMLDGVDFSAGREISSDPQKLVDGGTQVIGAVCDGVTRLLLRLPLAQAQSVIFSLEGSGNQKEDGILRSIDQTQEGNAITVNSVNVDNKDYALAIYQAPDNFARTGYNEDLTTSERALNLKVNVNGTETIQEIKLCRPPVVLVHGLWADAGMWLENGFRDSLVNQFPQIRLSRVNYPNDREFEYNKEVVKAAIEKLREQFKSSTVGPKSIAMVQADVVAHSMGGLLARIWAGSKEYINEKNYEAGDINKLITLDTPHKGSFLADLGTACIAYPHQWWDLFKKNKIINNARQKGFDFTAGALDDLKTTSLEIQKINNTSTSVPSHVIIGDYLLVSLAVVPKEYNKIHVYLATLGFDPSPFVISGQSDLVVSFDSQQGGLPLAYTSSIFNHDHMNAVTEAVLNQVVELLNEPEDSLKFNQGF